jgi:RNAse (barnase) inhibitor barstar
MGGNRRRFRGLHAGPVVFGVVFLAVVWMVRRGCGGEEAAPARAAQSSFFLDRPVFRDRPPEVPPANPPTPAVTPEGREKPQSGEARAERAEFVWEGARKGGSPVPAWGILVQRLTSRGLNLSESQGRELEVLWDRWKDRVLPGSRDVRGTQAAWKALEEEVRSRLTVEQSARLHEREAKAIGATWERHVETLIRQLGEGRPADDVPQAAVRALSPPGVPPTLLFPEAYGLTFMDLWDLLKEQVRPLLSAGSWGRLESAVPRVHRR